MAEVVEERPRGGVALEIPDRYLPGVPYRDLPEPTTLKRIVGPSVVLLAVSIGSGEYVLWPFISSRVGVALLWIAMIGILTQYFINMEIERYTLATGETSVTGFTRLWRHWAWLFILFTAIPWMWPGWATGASTTAGFVFGWETGSATNNIVTVLGLLAIGIALTVSPVVYNMVEKFQMVLIFVFLIFAVLIATDAATWGAVVTDAGLPSIVGGPISDPAITVAVLLGALAFAGAGGTVNLAQSNWIRDKGLGMGAYIPKIESPITGAPEAVASIGAIFPEDEENMRRWRGWWRLANQEQFIFFFLLGLLAIVILAVLTAATVFGQELEGGFAFIRAEGEVLGERLGAWVRPFFWLTGTVVLFSTNLGVLDHVGRVIADVLKTNWFRDNDAWSESKLYFTIVWAEIVIGSLILVTAIDQPLLLLVIASSLNGIVMFIYSILLIQLNRTALPGAIKIRGGRLAAMLWSVLFFGYFTLFLVFFDIPRQLTGG
jgi:ABC-type multidrug transport system fused ATPase/permease subunit